MPANTWQPPQTADRQLNASFALLADKLDGIDALLASVAVPTVRIARGSVTISDELYVEYRGGNAADVITLPDAAVRGTGRGSLITIQNFGTATVTVRPFSRNSLNDGVAFALAPNTGALCSGNGVSRWTAIKPGGGHIIQEAGVDRPSEGRLNFLSPFTATDNPTDGSTDIEISAPAGHVIEDEGTPLTQRANMNFVGSGVTAADSGGKTVVTIPGATAPTTKSLDYSIIDVVNAGIAATTNVAGNQTTGAGYFTSRAVVVSGIRFYWKKNGASKTINVALWTINSNTTGTKIANVDVAVNATGIFTGTFASAQSLAATSRFMVSIWEKGGNEFTAGEHGGASSYDRCILGWEGVASNAAETIKMCGHGMYSLGYFVAGANTYPGTARASALTDIFYPIEPIIADIAL